MIIGLPKEIKENEDRVGLTPSNVKVLIEDGHSVLVQAGAGLGSGFSDDFYIQAGACLEQKATSVYEKADMIIKVEAPEKSEVSYLRPGQILMAYLHLAANRELTEALLESKAIAIAYETVTNNAYQHPFLSPTSEIAGKLAPMVGANLMQKHNGGQGVLFSGIPGVLPAKVLVIGAGIVGLSAARIACGMGGNVTICDINQNRLRYITEVTDSKISTMFCNRANIESQIQNADLVIGAVLVHGNKTPRVISKSMLDIMKPKSILIDVAVDQGGCFETTKPTSWAQQTYEINNIVHYCVPNMVSSVPVTATYALTNVTCPFIELVASKGIQAFTESENLLNGINIYRGELLCRPVAEALNMSFTPPESISELN
jgi:alanine dehydrogenase